MWGYSPTSDYTETTARERGESTEGRQEDGRRIPYVRSWRRRGGTAERDAGAPVGTSPGGTKRRCLRCLTEPKPGPAPQRRPCPLPPTGRAGLLRPAPAGVPRPGRASAQPHPGRACRTRSSGVHLPAPPRAQPPVRGAPTRQAEAQAELRPLAPTRWAGPAAGPGKQSLGSYRGGAAAGPLNACGDVTQPRAPPGAQQESRSRPPGRGAGSGGSSQSAAAPRDGPAPRCVARPRAARPRSRGPSRSEDAGGARAAPRPRRPRLRARACPRLPRQALGLAGGSGQRRRHLLEQGEVAARARPGEARAKDSRVMGTPGQG